MRTAIAYTIGLALVVVAIIVLAHGAGQPPAVPNPDSQYRLGPDSLPRETVMLTCEETLLASVPHRLFCWELANRPAFCEGGRPMEAALDYLVLARYAADLG